MALRLRQISNPELVFGFVAPIGVDMESVILAFDRSLRSIPQPSYNVNVLKVTDLYEALSKRIPPRCPLNTSSGFSRYETFIEFGNFLREETGHNDFLAAVALKQIIDARVASAKLSAEIEDLYSKRAYLIRQFKRKEEIDLFRSVYPTQFFQVSIYSRRDARVSRLSETFASYDSSRDFDRYRSDAEKIVVTDENDANKKYGQQVAKIFSEADFVINVDERDVQSQVDRIVRLLFGVNSLSPTPQEYGMFLAKAATLRSIDLSRQVGAAILTPESEIVCLGSNEVPKAEGGTYWSTSKLDARDYTLEKDPNEERKLELLKDIVTRVLTESGMNHDAVKAKVAELLTSERILSSEMMDLLEYSRVIHAEMNALTDAARLGRAVKGATLYTTTFPCHGCAKHIVASGISEVIYLQPYAKSLVHLHEDSIEVEGRSRSRYADFNSVKFKHFYGVTPTRYRRLFQRGKRKLNNGEYLDYAEGKAVPVINVVYPAYVEAELDIARRLEVYLFDEQ